MSGQWRSQRNASDWQEMVSYLLVGVIVGVVMLFAAIAKPVAIRAPVIRGTVSKAVDADTIHVRDAEDMHTVRLQHVDGPEKKQPGGTEARAFASQFVGASVEVQTTSIDRYGRIVGVVTPIAGGASINMQLVEAGWAWHDDRYSKDDSYALAELAARRAGVGLWKGDSDDIAPWDWRKGKRQ